MSINHTHSTTEVARTISDLDGNAVRLTPTQIEALVKRVGILTGGISGWMGVSIEPGPGWMANVGVDKRLVYDLGLAAALMAVEKGDRAITGVIAHEIAHLRDTDEIKWPRAVKDKKLAHHMLNLVEDKRIEIIMAREFPGMAEPIRILRAALESPKVKDLMPLVPPHHQLLNSIYGVLWGNRVVPANPKAREAFEEIRPTIEGLLVDWEQMNTDPESRSYMPTNKVLKILVDAGLYDRLVELKNMSAEDQAEREEQEQESGSAESQPSPDDEAGAGEASPDEDEEGAEGDVDAEGGDEGEESGAASGEGDDPDEGDADDASGAGAGQGDEEEDGSGMPSAGQIAALPQDQQERLEESLEEAIDNGLLSEEEEKAAKELLDSMSEVDTQVHETGKTIDQMLDEASKGPDDSLLEDDFTAYNGVDDGTWEHSATLGQRFASILRENARDRWSNIGYRSGKSLHPRNLPFAKAGREDVFRKRNRLRNRKYAITLVCDVSGSMRGDKMTAAISSTVMACEALDLVQGVDFAVYMFGSRTACLKPLFLPLKDRRGKIGALVSGSSRMGGSTMMVPAIARAAEEQLRFTGGSDDVEHLIIILTDGHPSDGQPAVKSLVDSLGRGRGVSGRETTVPIKCVGVGIQTDYVKNCFPEWTAIKIPRDLPAALEGVLRNNIRKALR